MSEEDKGTPPAELSEEEKATLEKTEVVLTDDEKAVLDEESSKKWDSLLAQKKHFREGRDKARKEFEDYKTKHPETPPESKKEEKKTKDEEISSVKAELQEIRLAQLNPVLSSDDVKKAIKYAQAEGVEPQELIKSDFFQAYLEKKAEKEKLSGVSPNPSNRSGSGESNWTGNETAEEVRAMDEATFEKYTKFLEQKAGGKGSTIRFSRAIKV